MDKLVSILLAMLIGAGLMFAADRAPPFHYDVPIPFVKDIHYDSLGAKLAAAEKRLKDITDAAKRKTAQGTEISKSAGVALQKEIVYIRGETKIIREEVPKYVTVEADNRCVVPVGFVSVFNAAVEGRSEIAAIPGQSPDADSGVPLSTVADTTVFNLGVSHELLAEVKMWRQFYADLSVAYASP